MESTSESLMKTGIPGAVLTISGVLLLMLGASSTLAIYGGASIVILGVLVMGVSVLGRDGIVRSPNPKDGLSGHRAGSAENVSRPGTTQASRLLHGADSFAPAIGELTGHFNDWLDQLERIEDLWPSFDRWLRDVLNQFVEARRVRCFRILDNGDEPVSLTEGTDHALWYRSVPHGLLDHVIRSGHRYVKGAERQDGLLGELISEWQSATREGSLAQVNRPPDAIFPVRRRGRTIGMVVIGELTESARHDVAFLRAIEQLMNQFWRHVDQYDSLNTANRIDRASGVLNRLDLTQISERVLLDSSLDSEPVVVLAIVVEGVRWLDDHGQWSLRDWLMKQIGRTMREKLRSDDLVGRFSDDRFVAILRRLDISLGRIIAQNLMKTLNERIRTNAELCPAIRLRCGLAQAKGSDFAHSLSRSFQAVNAAREDNEELRVLESDTPMLRGVAHEV